MVSPSGSVRSDGRRMVAVHFHLFKNAGTSVEVALETFFGDRWASFDKASAGGRINQRELTAFLTQRPDLQAVSSHQLRVPLLDTDTLGFAPIVFLRDPLDRIRSAYDFERRQGEVSPSSRAAATHDLAGWIDFHRQRNSTQCANFQTLAFSRHRGDNGAPLLRVPIEEHLSSAIQYLDDTVPVVGVVESFAESWDAISDQLRVHYPDFRSPSVHSNSTTDQSEAVEDRIERLRSSLGDAGFERLRAENAADAQLHQWASDRLAHR